MRILGLIAALGCLLGCYAWVRTNAGTQPPALSQTSPSVVAASAAKPSTEPAKDSARIDFQTQIKPIFEARCQPCHFNGGKVYKQMPFDRAETIKSMGTKLFTRIKDENERRVISAFLDQK